MSSALNEPESCRIASSVSCRAAETNDKPRPANASFCIGRALQEPLGVDRVARIGVARATPEQRRRQLRIDLEEVIERCVAVLAIARHDQLVARHNADVVSSGSICFRAHLRIEGFHIAAAIDIGLSRAPRTARRASDRARSRCARAPRRRRTRWPRPDPACRSARSQGSPRAARAARANFGSSLIACSSCRDRLGEMRAVAAVEDVASPAGTARTPPGSSSRPARCAAPAPPFSTTSSLSAIARAMRSCSANTSYRSPS